MPQEMKKVNGRWVVTGAQQSSDLVPRPRPTAAAKPKPSPANPKPKGKAKPPQRPWWGKLWNDLQYELKRPPLTYGKPKPMTAGQYLLGRTAVGNLAISKGTLGQQGALGLVGATDNAVRMGYSAVQRLQGRPKADPNRGGFGGALNRGVENAYRTLGARPPSQMSQDERNWDQMRRSLALNAVLAPISPGFGAARAATALGMGLRGGAAFAFNEALSAFLDDNTGGNVVNLINGITGAQLPGAVNVGQDDMVDAAVKSFLPNAATSLAAGAAIGGAVTGFKNIRRNIRAQRAVQQEARHRARQEAMGVLQKDEAEGLDFTPEVRQPPEPVAAPPKEPSFAEANAAMEERLGMRQPAAELRPSPVIENPTTETFGKAKDPLQPLPSANPALDPWMDDAAYRDWLRQNASRSIVPVRPPETPQPPVEIPRFPVKPQDDLRGEGLADPWGMGPDPSSPSQRWLGEKAGASGQPEVGAEPEVVTYDPALPESTAISKAWEELSDSEINTVMSSPGTPVLERLNQVLEARQGLDTPPPLDAGMVMAPTDKLAEDYLQAAVGKLQGREVWQLRPLFDPDTNPDLWRRAQALSGVEEPAQLTKTDMVEALQAQAAEGGQIPIVNRMMGAQMMPTAEITPAPQVFQYKGGVNEAGEQIGNSLSGVERWDPNAEGIIQVWRDGAGEIGDAGRVYVVNGHNRLAAAQRMGIPSMRVEFLDAPTAVEARLQGAISNVSDGKGTVFDAAKLAREYGITDSAQLKALGKPGASGFWKEGIAMGRLPEDVFTAAVNEQIPLRRAVIIGESGADEETMRSAYRYLVQQGPENVKEGTLREMLAMAKSSPAASSGGGRQKGLFEGTEWDQSFNEGMLAKADLAAAVRLMLSKEKKLFGTVGRQAGQIERVGQVNAVAAREISGQASRALQLFDELKYLTGPVGDLLNEGTQRVLAGQSAAEVAKGIKNRLAAAISEAMGKEVAPATDVVQEDMFAAAARQADEPPAPIELSPAERDAAEAQILHEAIAGGEVRPPATPLPKLPEPAQVRLDEAADEPLETRGQGRFFHGAAGEFNLERGGEFGGDGMNIYGDGLYVTDDLMTATKYRKKNAKRGTEGQNGAVYEVTEKAPVRLLDLDQPASKEVLRALRGGSKYNREWVERAVEEAGDGASLAEIMDEMRGWSREFDLPAYEVQESFLDFFTRLEKLGYGGLTHEGGHLAGGGKRLHQVRIYWNPSESVEIKLIDPYDSPLTPGSKQAQAVADEIRLAVEHKQADAAFQFEQQQALRDATDYEGLPFEQKKELGLVEGVDEAKAVEPSPNDAGLAPAPVRPESLQLTRASIDRAPIEDFFRMSQKEASMHKRNLEDIITKVAGDDVVIRFSETYPEVATPKEWGGKPGDVGVQLGFYAPGDAFFNDIIQINGIGSALDIPTNIETAYHEAWHRIQHVALGESEAKVLNSAWARLKIAFGSGHLIEDAKISYGESQAVAVQYYAAAKRRGIDPIEYLLKGYQENDSAVWDAAAKFASLVDRVLDFAEKVYNAFAGNGFISTRSIIESFTKGDLINTYDYSAAPLHGREGWFGHTWYQEPIEAPPKAAQQRIQSQIESNNQAIAEIRRKAQQEGC